MLTPTEASEVLIRLAEAARSASPSAWASGREFLSGCDSRTWLVLDDFARRWTSASGPAIAGKDGWLGAGLREQSGFVATITSWHADGRVRQRAVEELREIPGPLTAAALAVRSLDHVPQVREVAEDALRARANLDDAAPVLGVLLHGERRFLGPDARDRFVAALLARTDQAAIAQVTMTSRERVLRRWGHRFAHEHDLLASDDLLHIAATDPDQTVRRLAGQWLAPIATTAQWHRLLRGRSVDGRVLALTALSDDDLAQPDLVGLLCDRSPRVRRTAQWRAHRRGLDAATVYRAELAEGSGTPRRLAAAVDALADLGHREDAALIRPWVDDSHLTVRVSAVLAFAALSDGAEARAVLLPLLLDPSSRVTAAVARGLMSVGVPVSETQTAWEAADQPWSRRAAWMIRRTTSSWAGVIADLEAVNDSDEILRGLGTRGVQDWIRTSAASTYRKPTEGQLEALARLLPQSGLQPDEARILAFHAGIKPPSAK